MASFRFVGTFLCLTAAVFLCCSHVATALSLPKFGDIVRGLREESIEAFQVRGADPTENAFMQGDGPDEGPGDRIARRGASTATKASGKTAATATSTPYVFNATAKDLTVAYYGQSNITDLVDLTQLCAGSSVDVIVLAFISRFFNSSGDLDVTLDFNGYRCYEANDTQKAAGMSGLLDCVSDGFAEQVAGCQALGKKILISAGGGSGNLTIPSEAAAVGLAKVLYNLFLGGTADSVDGVNNIQSARPFGPDVSLDGFDIDNEDDKNAKYLFPLISTLRNLTKTDTTKKPYYFSAAPICSFPDTEIPLSSLLNQIDFWNVQFYNAQACQLGSSNSDVRNFLTNLQTWSTKLLGKRKLACDSCAVPQGSFNVLPTNNITYPRLLVGTRAFYPGEDDDGYVSVPTYKKILTKAHKLDLPNLAGAMFWDGAYLYHSAAEVDGKNRTFAQVAKQAL